MKSTIVACAVIGSLSACASPPEKIQAAPASTAQFSALSCVQLADAQRIKTAELETHSSVQKRTSSDDVLGVVLFGLPTGSMNQGSNRNFTEDRISVLKGELIAVQDVRKQKRC